MIVVLMGVTGSGKSTVGKLLAQELSWRFFDGDDFHSADNVKKMREGTPLSDEDRLPWLNALRETIRATMNRRENAVIACSALRRSYRQRLQISTEVAFVYLKANASLVRDRLAKRRGHFMNRELVQSQFDSLEEPEAALQINASLSPVEIVQQIRNRLCV
jgi:gluconokinase